MVSLSQDFVGFNMTKNGDPAAVKKSEITGVFNYEGETMIVTKDNKYNVATKKTPAEIIKALGANEVKQLDAMA